MSASVPAPLPWQQRPWQQLMKAMDGDSLPHAILLSGSESSGKSHFGRALAWRLLCESPAADLPCGQCRACELLNAGSHPDVKELAPLEDSRVIRIDQVRDVIEFATKTAALGRRKVILLHPAELMNINAANALLKCLEEPSPDTHLVLVSHRPSALAATIRSRCQVLPLQAPAEAEALQWLQSLGQDSEQARQLLAAASGRVMAAAGLSDSEELQSRQALLAGLAALAEQRLSALEFPQLVADLELRDVLGSMVHYLEQQIRSRSVSGSPPTSASFELLEDLGRLHRSVLQGANPNRQLTLEDTAARLAQVL